MEEIRRRCDDSCIEITQHILMRFQQRNITYEEIKDNDYNISVNSYLKTHISSEVIDIVEVNKRLAEIVPRQQQLRVELEEIIRELEVDYHE